MGKKDDSEVGKKCAHTGKAISKARRYYRNGLYYTNKTAFKAKEKKDKAAAQETAAA